MWRWRRSCSPMSGWSSSRRGQPAPRPVPELQLSSRDRRASEGERRLQRSPVAVNAHAVRTLPLTPTPHLAAGVRHTSFSGAVSPAPWICTSGGCKNAVRRHPAWPDRHGRTARRNQHRSRGCVAFHRLPARGVALLTARCAPGGGRHRDDRARLRRRRNVLTGPQLRSTTCDCSGADPVLGRLVLVHYI